MERKFKKKIKRYKISEMIFNRILSSYPDLIEFVDSNDYIYGSGREDKNKIYYDFKRHQLVCTVARYEYISNSYTNQSSWKQVILESSTEVDETLHTDASGSDSVRTIRKELSKYYTKKEIEDCLNKHKASYNYQLAQQHHQLTEDNTILKFNNCVKYDINGAHNDALCEIFPKAKDYFTKLYNERKTNPNNKLLVNSYVGCLVYGHRDTYNWIVQRTTKILGSVTDKCCGIDSSNVYVNTDGVIINDAKDDIEVSAKLGGIKREHSETSIAYTYQDNVEGCTRYWVVQMGDEIKGNLPLELRNQIDLRIGKVVHFKTIEHVKEHYKEYINVQVENKEIHDYE